MDAWRRYSRRWRTVKGKTLREEKERRPRTRSWLSCFGRGERMGIHGKERRGERNSCLRSAGRRNNETCELKWKFSSNKNNKDIRFIYHWTSVAAVLPWTPILTNHMTCSVPQPEYVVRYGLTLRYYDSQPIIISGRFSRRSRYRKGDMIMCTYLIGRASIHGYVIVSLVSGPKVFFWIFLFFIQALMMYYRNS